MKHLNQKLIMAATTLFMGLLFSSCIDLFDDDPCTECQNAINHYASAVERYGCDNTEIYKKAYQKMYTACGRDALDYKWRICIGEVPSACK